MEVVVESERQNPLLKRREVHFILKYGDEGKTPPRSDVRQKIAGLFSVEVERVVIDYIKPEFGKTEAKCYAKIYDSVNDLQSIEREHIIRRNFGKKEEGEEEEE